MGLMIDLTPDDEARLLTLARSEGVDPAEYARRLLNRFLSPGGVAEGTSAPRDRTLDLFAQWDAEDATDDPKEIARRIQEWEELKAGLNANRAATGERIVSP